MKTKTNKTQVETKAIETSTNVVNIFGQEVENKKYDLKELVAMMRARFETNDSKELPVGNMAYYALAFKQMKLVDGLSHETLTQIIIRIFELNGQRTDTTAKCMSWYQGRINKGKVDIHEDFKATTRSKAIVDISKLF